MSPSNSSRPPADSKPSAPDPRHNLDPSEHVGQRLYEELRRVASRYFGRERTDHTLQPTALVHEAWMRLAHQKHPDWESESHFVGIAARVMRQILIDHDRLHRAVKRGHGTLKISLDHAVVEDEDRTIDLVELDDAIRLLTQQDDLQGRIVELRFFGGLSVEETARVLDVSESTIKRGWRMARAFLYQRFDRESMNASSTTPPEDHPLD